MSLGNIILDILISLKRPIHEEELLYEIASRNGLSYADMMKSISHMRKSLDDLLERGYLEETQPGWYSPWPLEGDFNPPGIRNATYNNMTLRDVYRRECITEKKRKKDTSEKVENKLDSSLSNDQLLSKNFRQSHPVKADIEKHPENVTKTTKIASTRTRAPKAQVKKRKGRLTKHSKKRRNINYKFKNQKKVKPNLKNLNNKRNNNKRKS